MFPVKRIPKKNQYLGAVIEASTCHAKVHFSNNKHATSEEKQEPVKYIPIKTN